MSIARAGFLICRGLVIACGLLALANSLRGSGLYPGHPTQLPTGFQDRLIAGQIDRAASFAIAPDGRIFVVEQTGKILVVQNDVLLPEPFLVLASESNLGEGMFHAAFDPDFETNHWVYVYYLAPGRYERLVRVTAEGNTAASGSLVTLWDWGPVPASVSHHGGSPVFGENGFIYFGTGDADRGDEAQRLDSPHGKVLRITRAGAPAPGNPFVDTPGALPEIYAYGFRNAYGLVRDQVTGIILVSDVGQSAFEEINRLVPGGNYGWSVCEGRCEPPRAEMLDPLVTYPHGLGTAVGCAVMRGAFYRPARGQFPKEYPGKYFYADLCNGWIRTLDLQDNTTSLFATGLVHPEDVQVSPDGALYYLSRNVASDFYASPYPGQLRRIDLASPDAYE